MNIIPNASGPTVFALTLTPALGERIPPIQIAH